MRDEVTGIVLAGGLGRRMGGADKGLVLFRGRPLVAHALERLLPQVAGAVVSANQNLDLYAAFGVPVIPDAIGGFAGPLAGLHAALSQLRTGFAVTVPCDAPFLPADLVARLAAGLASGTADIAVASTLGRTQPVFALVRRRVVANLERFLAAGGRLPIAGRRF